jgi:hypothetical protein
VSFGLPEWRVAPNHSNNEWPRFRARADSILSPDQLILDRLPFGRCASPVISLEILRASFGRFPFGSSPIPFDVTISYAISVATAPFWDLLAHSFSSGLVEMVLGFPDCESLTPISRVIWVEEVQVASFE